jgi:peptidoglycan hydrolase-like protein with peptidoglycan-binding domain
VNRRATRVTLGLAGAAVAGAVAATTLRGGAATATPPGPPPVTFATVTRTDLVTSTLTAGTLGYAPTSPVVNQITGTYTALPSPGTVIHPGQALYQVDHLAVVLMQGRIPAWRAFAPGMTGGPDIIKLQRNLIALGYARGLFTAPSGQFDELTIIAVERWQAAHGYPATGQITLGQIIFLPSAVVVGALNEAPGQAASPGQAPYKATARQRVVTVPVSPNLPPVRPGEHLSIILPSGARTPGEIATIGPVPPGSGGSSASATTQLTVIPDHPAATGTGQDVAVQVSLVTQRARHVLAVPVSALLALAGGGYGVEVVAPSGAHHLVGVTTGLFANTLVEVSGTGIRAGVKVVTAQ